MSKKFSAQRKRAFLTYLAQSGNQTLSAERAKVSRSWVQLHRSTDAAFDAACREAILRYASSTGSAATQDERDECGPPAAWRYHDGHELVVRGTHGRRTQVARARLKQWTPRVERRFLAALAATCNVKAACAEVGMWPPSAYNHRHRWPAFARAWDEAVETGYARIEAALLEAGRNLFSSPEPAAGGPIREMTAEHALHLLHMHKHQVHGTGRKPGLPMPHDKQLAQATERLRKAMAVVFRDGPPGDEAMERFRAECAEWRAGFGWKGRKK